MDRLAQFTAGGWLLAAVMTFVANSNVEEGEQGGMREWAITLAILAVVAVVVYLVARGRTTPTTALVLAILAVVTLAAFWMGLTPIFAAAALAIALPSNVTEQEDAPTARTGAATAALALSVIALLAWVVIILTG